MIFHAMNNNKTATLCGATLDGLNNHASASRFGTNCAECSAEVKRIEGERPKPKKKPRQRRPRGEQKPRRRLSHKENIKKFIEMLKNY